MFAVAFVFIAGWLLASIIGSWAYFAGSPETKISAFNDDQKQVYQTLKQEREAYLKANRSRQDKLASVNSFSSLISN
jgi:hypothetical protein